MRAFLKGNWCGLVAVLLSGCGCKDIPVEERLIACTNRTLRFKMTVEHDPPYQFLLGLSRPSPGALSFRGEIVVSQSTGEVARIPIDGRNVTPCNWLHDSSGYILTWSRTNQGERLQTFLAKGRAYHVEVIFVEQPPAESSLWLSSVGKAYGNQGEASG